MSNAKMIGCRRWNSDVGGSIQILPPLVLDADMSLLLWRFLYGRFRVQQEIGRDAAMWMGIPNGREL
jgi:hypothetical protein